MATRNGHGRFLLDMIALAAQPGRERALAARVESASMEELAVAVCPEMDEAIRIAAISHLSGVVSMEAFRILQTVGERGDGPPNLMARDGLASLSTSLVGGHAAEVIPSLLKCLRECFANHPKAKIVAGALGGCLRRGNGEASEILDREMDRIYEMELAGRNNPPLGIEVRLGRMPLVARALGGPDGLLLLHKIGLRVIQTFDSDQCKSMVEDVVSALKLMVPKSEATRELLELTEASLDKKVYRPIMLSGALEFVLENGTDKQKQRAWDTVAGLLDDFEDERKRADATRAARLFGDEGIKVLMRNVRFDPSSAVRSAAADALKDLAKK